MLRVCVTCKQNTFIFPSNKQKHASQLQLHSNRVVVDLLFKFSDIATKELFVSCSVANSALFGILITIDDVNVVSSVAIEHCLQLHRCHTRLDHETSQFSRVDMNYVFLLVAALTVGSLHGGK